MKHSSLPHISLTCFPAKLLTLIHPFNAFSKKHQIIAHFVCSGVLVGLISGLIMLISFLFAPLDACFLATALDIRVLNAWNPALGEFISLEM
jgi:hypothetical protein